MKSKLDPKDRTLNNTKLIALFNEALDIIHQLLADGQNDTTIQGQAETTRRAQAFVNAHKSDEDRERERSIRHNTDGPDGQDARGEAESGNMRVPRGQERSGEHSRERESET